MLGPRRHHERARLVPLGHKPERGLTDPAEGVGAAHVDRVPPESGAGAPAGERGGVVVTVMMGGHAADVGTRPSRSSAPV